MMETVNLMNSLVEEVLEKPCFGFVCGLDGDGHPIMSRFFGFQYSSDLSTFTAYTFGKDFQRLQRHLLHSIKLSAVVSSPQDFKTIQLKGTFKTMYSTPEEEMKIPQSCNQLQSEILIRWGISKEVFANWSYQESVAVVMDVEEIYNQTPKLNTGNKIN